MERNTRVRFSDSLDLLDFFALDDWIVFTDLLSAVSAVVERAVVLVAVAMHGAKQASTSASEPCQADLLPANSTTVLLLLVGTVVGASLSFVRGSGAIGASILLTDAGVDSSSCGFGGGRGGGEGATSGSVRLHLRVGTGGFLERRRDYHWNRRRGCVDAGRRADGVTEAGARRARRRSLTLLQVVLVALGAHALGRRSAVKPAARTALDGDLVVPWSFHRRSPRR